MGWGKDCLYLRLRGWSSGYEATDRRGGLGCPSRSLLPPPLILRGQRYFGPSWGQDIAKRCRSFRTTHCPSGGNDAKAAYQILDGTLLKWYRLHQRRLRSSSKGGQANINKLLQRSRSYPPRGHAKDCARGSQPRGHERRDVHLRRQFDKWVLV